MLVFSVVEIFASQLISLFDTNTQVLETGVQFVRFIALDYLFVPFVFCINGLAMGLASSASVIIGFVFVFRGKWKKPKIKL